MYKPTRTRHFEYLWELMDFVEQNQCRKCVFSKLFDPDEDKRHAESYPMCYEIEGMLVSERPIEEFEDKGADGVVCTKFELPPVPDEPVEQGRLF